MGGNDDVIIDVKLNISDDYDSAGLKKLKQDIQRTLDNATKISDKKTNEALRQEMESRMESYKNIEKRMTDIFGDAVAISDKPYKSIEASTRRIAEIEKQIIDNNKYIGSLKGQYRDIDKDIAAQTKKVADAEQRIVEENARHAKYVKEINENQRLSNSSREKQLALEEKRHDKAIELQQMEIDGQKFRTQLLEEAKQELKSEGRIRALNTRELNAEKSSLQESIHLTEEMLKDEKLRAEYTNRAQIEADKLTNEYNKQGKELKNLVEESRELVNSARAREIAETYNERMAEKRQSYIKSTLQGYKEQISALNRQKAEVKEEAARVYYLLRALKMLQHSVDTVRGSMDTFQKKTINVFGKLTKVYLKFASSFLTFGKIIGKLVKGISDFTKGTKSATRANDGFMTSMKKGIFTILRYTIGIRSLYMLIRRLRSALSDGMKNLATQYSQVNDQMSSVISSLERMKNAIAAAVQPILNVLAPALERLSEAFSKVTYAVGSFFAALTGQDFVYYAKKVKKAYIEDEKAKKAKEELNDEMDRQLSGLDKLNVLTSPKDKNKDDDTDDGGVADMFDMVPVEKKFKDLIDKIKNFLKPITDAWAKEAEFVKNAWKYAWQEIVKLAKDIWRDFLRVWFEPETQRVFENIFHIIGDIGLIVGHLARNFREAWNHNENGYRILKAIRDIILAITEGLREAADYTVKWADKLNFIPLLDAIANVLEKQIVPAIQKIVALFVELYEDILLELLRYFIEDFAPIIVNVVGNIAEAVGNIAENFKKAWNQGNIGKRIVKNLERLFTIIGDTILYVSEVTKAWSKNLNFSPLLKSVNKLLVKMQPLIQFIVRTLGRFWTDVLLPIWKDFIEKALPKVLDTLGRIIDRIDFDQLSRTMGKLFEVIRVFVEKYGETLLAIFEQLMNKMIDFVNSGALDSLLDGFLNFIRQVDPETLATHIINLARAFIEVKLAFSTISKALGGAITFLSVLNAFKQFSAFKETRNISKQIKDVTKAMNDFKNATSTTATSISADAGFIKRDIMGVSRAAEGAGSSAVAASSMSVGAMAAVIVGIVAVVSMVVTLWNTNEEFRNAIKEIWSDLTASLQESAQKIIDSLNSLGYEFESLKDVWLALCNFFAPAFEGAFKKVAEIIAGFMELIAGTVEFWTGLMSRDLSQMGQGIKDTFSGLSRMGNSSAAGIRTAIEGYTKSTEEAESANKSLNDRTKEWIDSNDGLMQSVRDVNDQLVEMGNNSEELNQNFANLTDNSLAPFRELDTTLNSMGDPFETLNQSTDTFSNSITTKIPQATTTAESALNGLQTSAAQTSTALTAEGKNAGDGFIKGLTDALGQVAMNRIEGPFLTVIRVVKSIFNSHSPSIVFMNIGRDVIQGFVNGILAFANSPVNAIRSVANRVISTAKNVLSPSKLVSIGKNLLSGLASGIRSGATNVINSVKSIAGRIVGAARSAFQVHSPSKIFEGIGEMLTQGLAVGVEKDTDDVGTAFEDMIPDNTFLDLFYDRFISMLSSLREEAVSIVSNMIDEIEAVISRMDNLAMLEELSTKLSNIENIRIPNIVNGTKLPENEKFAQSTQTQVDITKLPAMLKAAFVEAISEAGTLQGTDGDIIIEVDGYEMFRAVRKENDKFIKQTGRSAFAGA